MVLESSTMRGSEGSTKEPPVVSPVKMAHFVLRTSRYGDMVEWYKRVLGAHVTFSNEFLTFLAYDDEHHRVAVIHIPGLHDQPEGMSGVHHVAFTYSSLKNLMDNYERLAGKGIKPVFCINHGPTTSLYYADPDTNQIELQVDNFDSAEEGTAFFFSPAFAENAVGVEFDPDTLLQRVRAGEPEEALKRRRDDGPRNLSDIKLR